jgi:hypothetical protein
MHPMGGTSLCQRLAEGRIGLGSVTRPMRCIVETGNEGFQAPALGLVSRFQQAEGQDAGLGRSVLPGPDLGQEEATAKRIFADS